MFAWGRNGPDWVSGGHPSRKFPRLTLIRTLYSQFSVLCGTEAMARELWGRGVDRWTLTIGSSTGEHPRTLGP